MLENNTDISRQCHWMRNLNASIQHAENVEEILVLNNAVGTVTARHPQDKKITKGGLAVGRAMGKLIDAFTRRGKLRFTAIYMSDKVASRFICSDTHNKSGAR